MYKNLWIPYLGLGLATKIETANPFDKFAVAVLLEDDMVGHLPKGKLGQYAKIISFFSRLTLEMSAQWLLQAKR